MNDKTPQFRHNGRFAKKQIITWKKNMSESMQKKHVEGKNSDMKSTSGRRIVDLEKLAKDMWCEKCDSPLSFRFLVKEDIIGLASVFHINCNKCDVIYQVKSSASEKQCSRSKYHVNFKLALAILDGGIGEMQLNSILSSLNLPTVNHNLLKSYERLVGPAIESVAKTSCHEAIKTEKELTIANEGHFYVDDEGGVEDTVYVNIAEEGNFNVQSDIDIERILNDIDSEFRENINLDSSDDFGVRENLSSNASGEVEQNLNVETDVGVEHNLDVEIGVGVEENLDIEMIDVGVEENLNSDSITTKTVDSKKRKVGLRVSYDGAWLKKGSGRCYNSKQGHGTAFGHYSRKCVAYGTRNKGCRFCYIKSKKKHDCRRNFEGSSKAMEADIAVEILTKNETFIKENVEIKTLIGDEDSCTIANVRRMSNHPIDKWTDINHATRKISKFLYSLKKISKAGIEYLLHCFTSALRSNTGNVESTRAALLNIVSHAFGEHDLCGLWCTYANDPQAFKHKYLPGGKPLVGEDLKASILPIFQQAADNAEKLAPFGSSQINENCNAVITTKAPKAKHYSNSSSSDFRVAAGISQVNLGTSYLNNVNTILGLSPLRKQSMNFRIKRDEKRKKINAKIKTPEFKKRRRALFRARQKTNSSAEVREGITYQSNCEIDANLEFSDKTTNCITSSIDESTKLVIFDIETTGLKLTDDIVQIAARCDELTYNAYIIPSCDFSRVASNITGLTMQNGQLFKNSIVIKTVSPNRAIAGFIQFLQSISTSIVLAAHNGLRFDVPRILKLIKQVNMMHEFQSIVVGFVDTLTFLKQKMHKRRMEKKSFAQSALAKDYLSTTYIEESAHDASVDVLILQQLINHADFNISVKELINSGVAVNTILNAKVAKDEYRSVKNALTVLKAQKQNGSHEQQSGISVTMINKIARAGITIDNLKTVYQNKGFEGIKIFLSQSVDKRPRVTSRLKTITALANRLEELKQNVQ